MQMIFAISLRETTAESRPADDVAAINRGVVRGTPSGRHPFKETKDMLRKLERSRIAVTTKRWKVWVTMSILFLGAACGSESGDGPEQRPDSLAQNVVRFDAVLRPVREGGQDVTAVVVSYELTGELSIAETFSLRSPIVYAGRTGMADSVSDPVVHDEDGAVGLTVEDDPADPGGFPFYRHWRADRPVNSPVTVSYRVSPAKNRSRGPQFDFYVHDGGFSTGGMALFVLPEDLGEATWRVQWDLSDLSPGSIAASTHGDGDFEVEGEADRLIQAYYMVGPIGRFDSPDKELSFHAYWLGNPPFDAAKEMAWVSEAYAYLRDFFQDDETSSYRVFVRALEGSGGGTALFNSFMMAVTPGDTDASAESPRGTMFHEMGHVFVGGLETEDNRGVPWFAEGLNVHYTRLLLLRSGLAPVSNYLDSINSTARAYYSNPYRNKSAAALDDLGFSTGVGQGSAQNVPYTRGSLYFAVVDYRIRSASDGMRTLDDVILPLFERRRNGDELTQEMLVDALVEELGPSARDEFESIIVNGDFVVPDRKAFGPCFDRRPTVFSLDDGQEFDGYEWFRIESIPDEECRKY